MPFFHDMFKAPYTSLQELNLDWLLTKVKNILRFIPDDGYVGQILRRTSGGAEWSDENAAPVTSVNGQIGDVVLTSADVGALPDDTKYAGSTTQGGVAVRSSALPYGEIISGSTATNLIATVAGIDSLYDGVRAYIRNDIITSASGCTMNVNGLGALPIYMSNADATRVTTQFTSANSYEFVYNSTRVSGGCWDMLVGQVNSNTIGYQLRTNSTTMALTDKCYRYRLLFTSANGQNFVPANTSTSTNATSSRTSNTTPIDPFGAIVYYGSTTALNAGAKPSKTVLWQQYIITLGYSFNNTGSGLLLTADKPVYIKCTPQNDGSAVLDYFSQTLPSTEDGKIYIYLGLAIDNTTVEMNIEHPVYYYKDSAIRLWTVPTAGGGAVDSVNGQTGTVVLDKSDIGLGNVDNVQQYSASNPPPYPVTSVNGQTGTVSISKSDVGLGNVDNVQQYSASNPPPYPVTSVNGQTGAVDLKGTHIALGSGAAGVTSSGFLFHDKASNSVRIYLYARSTSNITTSTVLATIPDGYRPAVNTSLVGFFYASGVNAAYYGSAQASGDIVQQLGNTIREVFLVGEYEL